MTRYYKRTNRYHASIGALYAAVGGLSLVVGTDSIIEGFSAWHSIMQLVTACVTFSIAAHHVARVTGIAGRWND